jgi:hypothetical protein
MYKPKDEEVKQAQKSKMMFLSERVPASIPLSPLKKECQELIVAHKLKRKK